MTISAAGYRDLANRDVLACAVVTVAAKLPMSMTPLMMVFLTRGLPGGYVLAASLVAVYVLGEVLGAALLGLFLDPSRMRGQLSVGLLVGAGAFTTLALTQNVTVLAIAAFVAGAGPSTTPGGLRAMLLGLVPDALVPKAMGFDAMITQVVWAVAPALVTVLALSVDHRAPVVVSVSLVVVAAWLVFILPRGHVTSRSGTAKPRVVASAWPIYLVSAAALVQLAVAELVLPALLEHRGIGIGWIGPLLMGFAACSALGAVLYGLRPWPGTFRTQGLVLLVVTATCVGALALFPNLPGIAGALLAAGLFQSGVLVTRSLALRERLPVGAHAAGFSMMYAVTGAGYGLTAVVAAWAMDVGSPVWAVFGGVAVTLVLTAVSAAAEHRQPR
ncbi:MFS transporter [Lentzea californiensis]|uniref:MFS transporter n=1 Tax=Lentzea californiensis TaxID=438851 RepID=UPI002165D441|nr:MFS transporter [Lentzea californiensis]MCR3752962.1 putative arabinose efflux permease, MFS family [Lentzea californiensis]